MSGSTKIIPVEEGYAPLADVLAEALNQAQHGKGKPFLRQPIMEIGRMVGTGYQLGQAMKKAQEAMRLPEIERKVTELLGAINYLAASVLLLREEGFLDEPNKIKNAPKIKRRCPTPQEYYSQIAARSAMEARSEVGSCGAGTDTCQGGETTQSPDC